MPEQVIATATEIQDTQEEWRPIPGWPYYQVSDFGRVKTCAPHGRGTKEKPWRLLSASKAGTGYLNVSLHHRGESRRVYIHRLVLEVFVGPPEPGMQARHIENNNRKDNRLENLKWGTAQENSDDMVAHGSRVYGSSCHASKLSEADIETIADLHHNEGVPVKQLAIRFGIRKENMSKILNGHHWGSANIKRKAKKNDFPSFITTKEAADRLGMTRARIHQLIKAGVLAFVLYRKGKLIDPKTVDTELARRRDLEAAKDVARKTG